MLAPFPRSYVNALTFDETESRGEPLGGTGSECGPWRRGTRVLTSGFVPKKHRKESSREHGGSCL